MTLELAQRLIDSEALPREMVEWALLRHAVDGVAFLPTLLQLYPQHAAAIEQELLLIAGRYADDLVPEPQLMARLPLGLCTRLMAFPIGATASTGVVDVLCADPIDGHAATEFGVHLKAPVRLLPGRLRHIRDQLAAVEGVMGPTTLRLDEPHGDDTRDWMTPPPIPLTRLASDNGELQPGTHRGIAPPAFLQDEALHRPLPAAVKVAVDALAHQTATEPKQAETTDAKEERSVSAVERKVSLRAPSSDELQQALAELAVAAEPTAVVNALIVGLSRVAGEVWVFAVRGSGFQSRARSGVGGQPRSDASVSVAIDEFALGLALDRGQYLGPAAGAGDAKPSFISSAGDEVCVTRIDVSHRPTLMLYAAGFDSAYEVSLRSDHLGRAASDALGRIVLAKKGR